MFANQLTLTMGEGSRVFERINQDAYGSEYSSLSAIDQITMKIRHSTDKADSDGIIMRRHNVYVERTIFPTPTTNMFKQSVTVTIRHGKFESTALADQLTALTTEWAVLNAADLSRGVN